MTVAVSILLAVVVGGVFFMLIERWQRPAEASTAPKPQREVWTPETPMATTASLFVPRSSQPLPPGRSAESTLPLPGNQRPPEKTEPLPPRRGRTLWEDPPHDDDDDRRPPGLWSGWADR